MIQLFKRIWDVYVGLLTPVDTGYRPLPYAVQCCGCKYFLGVDSKVFHPPDGIVDWGMVAGFPTHYRANEVAAQAGWDVGDGTDHRCPECLSKIAAGQSRGDSRGAIIRHGGRS